MCTVYFPAFDKSLGKIRPCRHVCLAARDGCGKDETLVWPNSLECSQFPVKESNTLCIDFPYNFGVDKKTTPRPVPKKKRIGYGKFLNIFWRTLNRVSKDLTSMYNLLAEEEP